MLFLSFPLVSNKNPHQCGSTHLCHQGIEREGDITTQELKGYTKKHPYQDFWQLFMEARGQPELILQWIILVNQKEFHLTRYI